jgi:hypothetical protein
MNKAGMREIARASVERHRGDLAAMYPDEECTGGSLYDEAYTLAFDALVDSGVGSRTARRVAAEVARCFARAPSSGSR